MSRRGPSGSTCSSGTPWMSLLLVIGLLSSGCAGQGELVVWGDESALGATVLIDAKSVGVLGPCAAADTVATSSATPPTGRTLGNITLSAPPVTHYECCWRGRVPARNMLITVRSRGGETLRCKVYAGGVALVQTSFTRKYIEAFDGSP